MSEASKPHSHIYDLATRMLDPNQPQKVETVDELPEGAIPVEDNSAESQDENSEVYNAGHVGAFLILFTLLIIAIILAIVFDQQTDAIALGGRWAGNVLAFILVMNVVGHGVTVYDKNAHKEERLLTTQALTFGKRRQKGKHRQKKDSYVTALRRNLASSMLFNALASITGIVGVPLALQQIVVKNLLGPANPSHLAHVEPGLAGFFALGLIAIGLEALIPDVLIQWIPDFLAKAVGVPQVGEGVRFIIHKVVGICRVAAAAGMFVLDVGTDAVIFGPVAGLILGFILSVLIIAHYLTEIDGKPATSDAEKIIRAIFKMLIGIQATLTIVGLIGIPAVAYMLPIDVFPKLTVAPLLVGWNLFTVPMAVYIGFDQYKMMTLHLNGGLRSLFRWT